MAPPGERSATIPVYTARDIVWGRAGRPGPRDWGRQSAVRHRSLRKFGAASAEEMVSDKPAEWIRMTGRARGVRRKHCPVLGQNSATEPAQTQRGDDREMASILRLTLETLRPLISGLAGFVTRSFVPEGVDWVDLGGFDGGVDAEEDADGDGDAEGDDDGGGGDDGFPFGGAGD